MTADVHALAGAYAVDALPADERAFFERHLQECEACAREVDELTETAAAMGRVAAETPPPELRDRLLSAVDVTRQLPPAAAAASGARSGLLDRLRPLLAPVAACLAVAVVVLTGVAANLDARVENLESELAAGDESLVRVLAADDVQTIDLAGEDGQTVRFHYSSELDRAVLVADGLPDPGSAETYELWLFHDGEPVPAGVFDPAQGGRVLQVVDGNVTGAEDIAVTLEPHGGNSEPTGPVVLSGSF